MRSPYGLACLAGTVQPKCTDFHDNGRRLEPFEAASYKSFLVKGIPEAMTTSPTYR